MKTHIVQPGEENLEIIAKKYNLNPGDLAIYNRIANNDNLVPGQEIKLELPKDAKPIVVRLGKNDTLETVAKQFNTSVDRLMALNNLPNTNVSEGATLVAWDPFRMNYTNISKAEDLDTLAKQLNTSKDLLLKSNPHVDPNDIKPNTSLFVPWQLNRYVEPPKETKTYSPPKEAPKEEPVDEVPPKTEPLKVDKVPAYAGEKEGEFLLKNYYDHHVFLTEKPTMKPSNWWDKLWGFNDLYREREKEKYIKDITDELLKATNDAFKAYKKAEKEGDRYEMQKQLTWIDNTHKEFERITGIKKGFDPAVVVKDIMRPEARIAEEEANKMEKELALLRAKETDIAGLPESVLSDDEALLDYSTDTFENLNEVQTEGIKKGYIVRKDIDPKTVNPESIDAIINYSGFSLTDKAKSMLDDFKKANDIPYDISKLSENLTKYFGEFNTDISNALYEQDYNKRVKNQKEFLRKYEDLAIVHEQINPNFLKYNQLYLDYSDLNNKIENILRDLKSINNSDIILEALTSGNLEAYKERLDSLGIKQSDIAKVGNLLSEYEAYSDKIVAIQSGFSQINQDLENDLELFTKALNNFDTNLNIKEFFISEANPTSEFGKSIKSLATLSFEASKLRGSTIEDNKRLVEFQDFLNWYQSYVEAATSNFNAISLLNIRNDMWQNISGLTEQRKSEAKNFANWFNPKYNDITFGERAYTTFVESLVNLTKVPVVGDVAEKVFSALDWYNNVALVEYVFPVAKTYRSTVDMAGWLLPRKLELEANLLVGNYSEEEKERQRREFEEKFQQQAETRFGLKDYDLRNIDLVWSHFATGSLEKKVIPIYDSNGNMMKDSNGNIMTSEIFYNKIRLQRDWDLFEVLKKGNRLDLLQDIRDLNEGKDLRNLKAGDYINLPKLDYGSRGPLIRGGEDFWWSPQDYFENAITNPTATEGVNQLVEIFLDPGTYILKSPYALAKGSIVFPIKFLTGKNIKGLSAITNEALIAVHKALEHNFSFPTFEKFFPKIQDLHASWNKKVIEGIEAFAPKEKKATSWWQIPAQIDAIQGKILNIVKSYPVSRLAIEGISNTIDLFSKPVDQFSFKLLTEANSSVLNIFDNFKLDYLSDHVPTTKTVFNKIKEHQVVSVNLSSGKKIVGVVNRAPSGAGLRGSIRTKGKDIILDSNSFDVKLKDGTVVTVYEKNVSDIFTFNSKEVREMTTSWKKTNPKEKYFYDTIKYNLPGIKVNKVNTFNLKKGDYIVSGQDIGSVVSVKDNKVKIKTFDNNENLIEKEIIPTKEVSLIDEEYIKNLNFNWKNAYANTLLPLKKALAVTTGGIQWFIDYLALGTLLNRLPFELRARANNLINKATVTLIAKSSLSATEIWKYFADAFEDSQRRYLLTRKLRIDNKWVELKWNEVWNSKTKKIEVVENPDKKFVLEEKFRSLLLEPGGASLDDWKILSKYNVYPSDIYKAIQKLLTRLSRGDEVANLLKQKSDLINDLIKVLDVNNLNLEGRRISSHFNEDWNKYLIKKGITSRKVREDIVHAANDFGKKIANIDDENLISTARNEIKQIYGEFVSKEAEAVWNIYKEYVSDLLEKQKTQIDSVIVDLPAGVDITFESVEKKLGRLDEIVFQKRTFVNRGGEPVYVFEPGAKKADMIEAIGRLSYEEKLLQVNEKILEGFNVAKIIEDFYEDAFIGMTVKDVSKQGFKDAGVPQKLIQEAKKYKSAEEFVKAQELKETGGRFGKGEVTIKTTKEGDVFERYNFDTKKTERVGSLKDVKPETRKEYIEARNAFEKSKGTGAENTKKSGDRYFEAIQKVKNELLSDEIKTKSQLTDIWKQANQETPEQSLIQEAKKYKSAEEFVRWELNRFSETTQKPITVYRGDGKGIGNVTLVEGRYFAVGNKKTYKLYKDYLAVNKKAELPDFIAWVDTYQSLKRSDFSSYKLLKDTISKQIKGSSPSDKLRLELMELLDSKFPLLRTHDYTKTVDTLLNAKRMSDKAFSDAAKVLDHYLNKRRHPVVLSNKKFMVIDTETTGLNVAKDDAFQFSWKIIDGDGKVIDTHNYYRAFDSKFTEAKFLSEDALKAQKVHGITIEKLKESNPKDIKEIINAFAESISSVDSIIAHNSDFDIEFIKKAIEEADGSPDAIFRGIDIIDTNKRNVIDKGWEGGKLDDLYRKYMGGSLVGAHNALKDVDALIDIYKKALREGKLNERIFKSQEKNIYNNLVKLRDQLDVFQKRIELPVGIGKQFNFVATKTLTPERIKVIREEVARNLFNQESERLFNLSTEDIVKELSIPGAISKAIKDGQVAHSPRKNIIGDFKDKNIRDILFFNQDKFKEIDSKIKKINKDLEKGKLTSVEKKKLIKELDTLNFEKSQYDPIKNNLPENSGIRVISEDYVPDEKELADLKKLIDDGWRFVVYSKSRSRLSNDPPAVKLLRSLGLAEEYQMKSPEAAGKLFDFYVYNTKSNKLLSRDLVGITSEYVDEYTTVPGILGILYRSTDSKEYIVSLYKKLSKKLKTVDPEEDITKVINSSYFFDTIYNFVIRNKNIFKGKEFEEFLPRFRFLKNLRKAKSSPDVSILMINSIENLKLNNVNVDVVLLGKLNKEQLKAVNHFNDVIEMEELNLSPNIRLEDKINKTREIKKYNDEISIKLEAEDKVAYPKIELTNEDLNAVKKIIDDVSSKVFDDLTPLKKFVKNQDIDIEKSLIDGENISIESYVNKLFKETEEDYRALRFSEFEITKKGSEEEPLAGSSGDLIKHTFDRWIDDQLDILNIVSYEDLDTIKSLMKSIGAKEQIRENFQGKKVSVYEISLNDAYYYRVKGLDPNALIHKPKVTKKEYLNVKTSYIVPGVYGGKTVNFVFGDGSFIIKGHYGHFKNVDNKIVYSIDTSPENIKKLDLKDGDIIYTNTTMAENFKWFNDTDAIFHVKVKEYNGDYLDEPSNIVDLTRGGRKKDLYNIYIVKNEKLRKPRIENVYTGKAYDGSGYHIKGKDGKFYDKKGYDPDGYDIDGFNRDGFDRKGFDKNGYNIDGLDALGFDKDGFHWFNGLNKDGTKHKSGVSKSEYNKFLLDITGYGLDGFDLKGFSKNKYHIDDYKKTGFGPDGRDKLGFDKNKVNSDGIHINEYKYKKGFVTDGRDKLGFDKKDINRYGYHRDVYKKNVYDFDGYDIYGFNKDGFNRKNKHKSSYERNDLNSDKELRENGYIGYDRNGRDIYGFDRDGFDKNGNHIGEYLNDGFAKDGYNIYNFDRDGFHRTKRYHKNDYINGFGPNGKDVYGFGRDGFNDKGINIKGERKGFDPDGYNKDGYDREGYDRKGFDRSGYDRDGYNLRMEHKDGGYNLDTLRSIIEKNIDTEKKSYYLLDDVGWRNDKYSDVSFVIEEMPSLDLPNKHSEVIVPKRATITETIEVKEEFPDSFAIKKEDGTSMFIEGNTKTKINNIIFKSKSTGDYSLFFPPKFLFDFDKIDLDRTRLIKKLLPEDSPKTDYIVIDVPNNSYINKLKKDLDTLDLDALKKYDLEKDIEKAIKERDSADAFEKVIKETDELKGIKIYRISSIEGIALEENLESINKFRDSRFNKENGLFISSNPDKTKDFLDFKLFTPRESKILENMNNVFTEIKDLVRSEKLHGKSAFYTKQFSIFSEPVNLDKSIESLVRNIERGAAVDDLEKVILETVTKTKRAWDGKNVVVIALDDATSLTGEFYEAINDIIEKNKRLKTKTKILFPDHPNLLERDAKAYLLSRGFDENLIGVVDLDHVPVAKTYKDFKITDQTKAIKDLINLQNEKMSRASYSLVIGKIEDDVAGIIPKRLLLAQNSKEAGILVMSDNLILKDQINVMKGFLVENTDSAYKFPSACIRDELFNKKITFQRALEKTIIASSRKEFQKEWVKFINEETNAYRETVESQYKPYLAGGSNIELELYREMVEEQVQRFRDAFKPIEKYILKWDGSEPVLDKYLRSARERVLKDLINDIAEGKRDRAIFENYLEKGDVQTVGYFLRKNLGYNTTKFLIALPGYLQTIFIQSVLRLMPRWSINNALDDLIKTLIFDRDFKKFLSGIWLQGKIFVNFYGTLLKHGKIDVSNSIMSNFFRLQKKLGIINNKEFNLKIRKLPKKGFYDLSELLKEWGHEDWSKMIRYIDDITIVKKDKKGKSILDKEGREVSQTYSAIDLDYMMSTGIQEIYSSPEEALLYFKRIIPKNANPLERIGFKAKEWNANLDMFYSQTERLRRAIALQRALQDQTIDMAKAKAFVSDFFFDYKAVNRAGVFFRKFFPFFTFSYFTARLYLKLLLGRYGYQTFRAGVAIMQIWEANTAHLPEMYKDRISIKIGDREFLIRPNISLIDVMRFVFDPSK